VDQERLDRVQSISGHVFADPGLVEIALTHPSYSAEHPGTPSYDRLEFLGDTVLGYLVAERLFRRLPDASEGELTERKSALVNGALLAEIAERHGLDELIAYGKGELASIQGRTRARENALEALIGAVFLDGGIAAASDAVKTIFGALLDRDDLAPAGHPKSVLAARTQALGSGTPAYRVRDVAGPVHAPVFTVEALLNGRGIGVGEGRSKQAAEKAAAAAALAVMDAQANGVDGPA